MVRKHPVVWQKGYLCRAIFSTFPVNIRTMHTIEALEREMAMQLGFLRAFVPQKTLSKEEQRRTIFCGAGDSFAAAQLAEVFSGYNTRAHDPLDLVKNKDMLRGRDLYLISVSGNTASNIALAKIHKKTVAITADKNSRLARACHRVIPLKFESTGMQTSGSISFLATALTCLSLVTKFRLENVPDIYKAARKTASIPISQKIYVLGNLYTMPLAFFCAAKLSEVLGTDAHYERIEQFCHAGVFTARKGDTIILFEKKNPHNQRLLQTLGRSGLVARRMDPKTDDPLGQVLFFIFVSEFLALRAAKKKKRKDCFFIEETNLRNTSSSMIY